MVMYGKVQSGEAEYGKERRFAVWQGNVGLGTALFGTGRHGEVMKGGSWCALVMFGLAGRCLERSCKAR